jgi:hypothetical protein
LTQALEAQQMLGIPLPRVPHLQIAIFFSVFLWCFLEYSCHSPAHLKMFQAVEIYLFNIVQL